MRSICRTKRPRDHSKVELENITYPKYLGDTGPNTEHTQHEDEVVYKAPNDKAYKWWSCHKLLCKLCRNLPLPAMGSQFTLFLCKSGMWTSWMAGAAPHKSDVETNPGLTTTHKVWICEIDHKQIHCMKQISIQCNRVEDWVHLRCPGIC